MTNTRTPNPGGTASNTHRDALDNPTGSLDDAGIERTSTAMTEFSNAARSDETPPGAPSSLAAQPHRGTPRATRRAASRTAFAAALLAIAAMVVACGSTAADGTPAVETSQTADTQGGATGDFGGNNNGGPAVSGREPGAGGGTLPGASGTIAAVEDSSMQVQSTDSQTTVDYNQDTQIQQTVTGSQADITAGVCLTAIAAATESSNSTPAPPSATGDGTGGQGFPGRVTPREITATTVTIGPATDGTCGNGQLGGFGGGGFGGNGTGARPTFNGDTPPSGVAGFPPDGSAPNRNGAGGGGFSGFGGIVSGQVVSVSGSTISVAVTEFEGRPGQGPDDPSDPATPSVTQPATKTTTSTVTVTAQTTYTKTVAADASAIKVGLCAFASGTADDTGAIAATDIRLSDPVADSCSAGLGAIPRGGSTVRGQGGPVTTGG